MKVPIEVSLLDYAGFKLRALAHAKSGDWKKAQDVAAEAQANWSAIRSRVADKKLLEAVNIAVDGMKKACISQNSEMMSLRCRSILRLLICSKPILKRISDNTIPQWELFGQGQRICLPCYHYIDDSKEGGVDWLRFSHFLAIAGL